MTEILIFGVDGLNPDMVNHLTSKGEMPNFKKLQDQENTVYGDFKSFICDGFKTPHTGPMWTSLYTGLKPEEHGLKSGGWNDGDSKFHVMHTVWDTLSEEDKKIIMWGMPMTYKAKNINGEMVSGFISPSIKSLWNNCVHPDTLADELGKNFMENTASYVAKVKSDKGAHPSANSEKFYNLISEAEQNRIQKFVERYNENSADIAAYGTTYADKIGHVDGIGKDREYAQKAYKEVDDILGQLLETLKPEHVAVISDHGFSEYSHDLEGYYLDTTGAGMQGVFDFTPYLLQHFDLEYHKEKYGPQKDKDQDLSPEEIEDVKEQLDALGYFQ